MKTFKKVIGTVLVVIGVAYICYLCKDTVLLGSGNHFEGGMEEDRASPYVDVELDLWFRDVILDCLDAGLFLPSESEFFLRSRDKFFYPDEPMALQDMCYAVWILSNGPKPMIENPYENLKKDSDYYEAILWCTEYELLKKETGQTDLTVGVTRQDALVMLYQCVRLFSHITTDVSVLEQYSDTAQLSPYAVEAASWATEEGMVSRINYAQDDFLCPKDILTRAEAASLLDDTLTVLEQEDYTLFQDPATVLKSLTTANQHVKIPQNGEPNGRYGSNSTLVEALDKQYQVTNLPRSLYYYVKPMNKTMDIMIWEPGVGAAGTGIRETTLYPVGKVVIRGDEMTCVVTGPLDNHYYIRLSGQCSADATFLFQGDYVEICSDCPRWEIAVNRKVVNPTESLVIREPVCSVVQVPTPCAVLRIQSDGTVVVAE